MMKTEILKWVTLLLSSLPCRLPSGIDLKLALEGYAIALEGCDLVDLETAVKRCIKGVPERYQWAPSAPELAQLARDAKARREWVEPILEDKTNESYPTDEMYARMTAKWEKLRPTFGNQLNPDDWVAARRERA